MFTQFNKKSNNSINKQALLTFEYYNDYTMPQPASCKSQDGFGYFNNAPVYNYDDADWDAPSNTAGPASLLPAVLFHQPSNENNINGANRAIAQVEVTQTLMLKKVTDLYGKMEEFVYARNNFHAEPNPVVRHEEVIHGLRVFQLIQYDQTQPAQKKYSRYDYLDEDGFSSGVKIRAWTDGKWFYVHGGSCPLIFRSANISSKKTIILNQILAYSRVKITRFTDPNNIATSTIGSVINTYTTDVTIPINNNPQNPYLARPNRWGDLLSTTQYNKNNQVIQKTLYTYVYWPGSGFQCSYTFLTGKTSAGLSSVYSSYDYTFYMDRKALSTVEQFNYNAQAELLGTEKTTFHHDGYQQVVKEEKEVNGVLKGATYYKYPYDYSIIATTSNNNAAAILKMVEKKMESTVVEQINTQYENNVELVTSAGFTLFKHNQINNLVLPDKVLAHKMVSPIAINGYNGLSFHTTTGNPTYNNNFELKTELTKYDELNLLVESKNKGQLPSAIYNNLGGETYFSVSGATVNQMGYMGLEEDEMNRLDQLGHIAGKITLVLPCPTSNPLSTDAFSGSKSFNAGICPGAAIRFATLPDGRTYKLRYWIKNGTASFAGSAIVVGASKVLRTIGNWELREHVLTGSGALLVGGTGLIDDVLVYPVGSAYSYNVFNQTGDISCECDETGNCTFYEYDDYNRLTTIRNIDKQILKRVEYSIQHLH